MSSRSLASKTSRYAAMMCGLAGLALAAAPAGATGFSLTSSAVVIDTPAPLFTTATVTGMLTLSNAVLPGESFGSSSITGLNFSFGGIPATLTDIIAGSAPDVVQAFGTRSADGLGFSVFDLRFTLPSTVAGCSFTCAGQIVINSPIGPNDPSNFIALDDLGGTTLSVIESFTPHFALLPSAVPDAEVWTLLTVGFGVVGLGLRRRRAGYPGARPVAA